MSKKIEIGGIKVEMGSKTSCYLNVQDDDVGTVKLLVNVINGTGEGPVLAVTGGMYGSMYGGIDAIIQVTNEIDPKKLNGTLITVPVMAMPQFQKGLDRSPIDGLDLNRVFPGDPKGSSTRRIAHAVFNEVVKKAQYHLDLRGGDLSEIRTDVVFVAETGKRELDDENISLAKILGTKYYYTGEFSRGWLAVEAGLVGVNSLMLMAYKGLGSYDEEDVEKNKRGIYNLLKQLKMMEGEPDVPHPPTKLGSPQHTLRTTRGGLLYYDVKYGTKVSKGQKVAEIRNLKGETLETFTSPIDGIVLATWCKHVKQPGELVFNVYTVIEE